MPQPEPSTDLQVADTPGMSPAEIEERMQLRGMTRDELTSQQEQLMIYIAFGGMSIAAAARAAGYRDIQYVYEMLKREDKARYLKFFKEQAEEDVRFTRNHAHAMLMQAWTNTANATEQVKVVDSLTKLHGLNEPDPNQQVNVQINVHNAGKVLENMSDEELLRVAGQKGGHLDPERPD